MGVELGGPGGKKAPSLCHSVQGRSGGLPHSLVHSVQGGSRGLAPRFRPQCLEITNFVTISVMFCVVFPAFHHLFTPPKTPSFPIGLA